MSVYDGVDQKQLEIIPPSLSVIPRASEMLMDEKGVG